MSKTPRPHKRKRRSSGIPTSKTILELYPTEKLTEVVTTKVTSSMARFLRRRNASKWVREAILEKLKRGDSCARSHLGQA